VVNKMTQEEIDNAVAAMTTEGGECYPFDSEGFDEAMSNMPKSVRDTLAKLLLSANTDFDRKIFTETLRGWVSTYWEEMAEKCIALRGENHA